MASSKNGKIVAGIGDAAVSAKTGRTWVQWRQVLDKAGAKKMSHKEIARFVARTFEVGPWWSQMVTVGYEQVTGRRKVHETARGFSVGVSRVIAVPISALSSSWATPKSRAAWMGKRSIVVRKATANKSIRIACDGGKTSVEVNFYRKGEAKSQVTVQHDRLADEKTVAKERTFWTRSLDKLKSRLQRSPISRSSADEE